MFPPFKNAFIAPGLKPRGYLTFLHNSMIRAARCANRSTLVQTVTPFCKWKPRENVRVWFIETHAKKTLNIPSGKRSVQEGVELCNLISTLTKGVLLTSCITNVMYQQRFRANLEAGFRCLQKNEFDTFSRNNSPPPFSSQNPL